MLSGLVISGIFAVFAYNSFVSSALKVSKVKSVELVGVEGTIFTLQIELGQKDVIKQEDLRICLPTNMSNTKAAEFYNKGAHKYLWDEQQINCNRDEITDFKVVEGAGGVSQTIELTTSGRQADFMGVAILGEENPDTAHATIDGQMAKVFSFPLNTQNKTAHPVVGPTTEQFTVHTEAEVK
jgi:hypothetical protein